MSWPDNLAGGGHTCSFNNELLSDIDSLIAPGTSQMPLSETHYGGAYRKNWRNFGHNRVPGIQACTQKGGMAIPRVFRPFGSPVFSEGLAINTIAFSTTNCKIIVGEGGG